MRILSWMASESCACLPVLCALPNTVKRNDKEVKVIYENKCLWMSIWGVPEKTGSKEKIGRENDGL